MSNKSDDYERIKLIRCMKHLTLANLFLPSITACYKIYLGSIMS